MYTTKDFKNLPKNEQVYTLFHEGKELLDRKKDDFRIKLFAVHNLFVEIWYHSGRNIIEKIEVIREEDLITLYDKEIHLSQLIKK